MTPNTCDSDGDGVEQKADNCPTVGNVDQADWDADGVGNACDATPGTAPAPPPTAAPPHLHRRLCVRASASRPCATRSGATDSSARSSPPAVGCRAGVDVTLWRKRSGADRKLVVLHHPVDGEFRTKAPRRPPRYYASVGSADQPLCSPSTSRVVRIRR